MRLQIIYLAADNGRRFRKSIADSPGEEEGLPESVRKNKLFYKINGKPMYLHLLEHLIRICERHPSWNVTVVTRYKKIWQKIFD